MYSPLLMSRSANNKIATYSSSQCFHAAHHKICRVFFRTSTSYCSKQKIYHVIYVSATRKAQNKICHVF